MVVWGTLLFMTQVFSHRRNRVGSEPRVKVPRHRSAKVREILRKLRNHTFPRRKLERVEERCWRTESLESILRWAVFIRGSVFLPSPVGCIVADSSFFEDQVIDLNDTQLTTEIEDKIVDVIESLVPPADRSSADVTKLSFDRTTLTAMVEVKVRVKNSDSAFVPFSIPSTVSFEYNLKTRETSNETLSIQTPSNFSDIKMDIESLKEIMNGNYAKALELIPNGGGR